MNDNSVKPIIARVNSFDEDAVSTLADQVSDALAHEQPLMVVEIDSYGGQVYSLLAMIDILDAAKPMMKIATVCSGKAMSCGAVLLASGSSGFRFASPNSTIMVHKVTGGGGGFPEDMEVATAECTRLNAKLLQLLGKYSSKGTKYFQNAIKRKVGADWYMSAPESKRHGLVDHVRMPVHRMKANVDHHFG